MVRVESVEVVDADAITDEEAQQAGWPDAARLRKRLNPDESLPTYRVRLVWDGEDPRIALREDAALTDEDVATLDLRLERLDRASPYGAWTMSTLALIVRAPAATGARPRRDGRPRDRAVQARRPQAQGDGPDRQLRRGLRDLAARTRLPGPDDPHAPDPIGWDSPNPRTPTRTVPTVDGCPSSCPRSPCSRRSSVAPAAHADDAGDGPPTIEDYASYQGQTTCHPKPRKGTVRLGEYLVATYGGGGGATGRACGGSASEHKDGRAIDWTLDATSKADRQIAKAILTDIFATDEDGNTHALARRMGIMYVIWNDHMYSAWDQFEVDSYLSSSCKSKSRSAPRRCGTATTCTSRCPWTAPRPRRAGSASLLVEPPSPCG